MRLLAVIILAFAGPAGAGSAANAMDAEDAGDAAHPAVNLEEMQMGLNHRPIREDFWVAPQISVADVKEAAALGVTLIINNRPDGEMIGQPTSAEIEAAAKAAGVAYAHIPVDINGVTPQHTGAMEQAIDDAEDGPTLAYCRSGTRSTLVFAYAEARFGKPVDLIIAEAAEAGYDISGHEPALVLLHEAHKSPRTEPPV